VTSPGRDRAGRLTLIAGATGYIGGRLLKILEANNQPVRCLARHPEFLRSRVASTVEIVKGDALEPATLSAALNEIHTAYYLVHSMGSTGSFEEEDKVAAQNFAAAAHAAGVRRIVYLGGLGASGAELSSHLSSRQQVGEILRSTCVPTIEFRASIVIGSGSLSFEIIRALVEKLPVMVTPRWVQVKAQPIAVEDVISYLVAALDLPEEETGIFEIGGADQVSYRELMNEYARQRGLKRWMISVPVLTPRLSSLWLGLVTPVYARVGRKLVESLRNETIVRDDRALRKFAIRPRGVSEAIQRALAREDRKFADTRWNDALSSHGYAKTVDGVKYGARIIDSRSAHVAAPAHDAFAPVIRIGGDNGWYFGNWLWRIRGWLDLFVGGPGLRRGRRDPANVAPGDALDFWRVEAVEPDHLLRLQAEMHLPGRAWLQFEVEDCKGGSTIRQTAIFDPLGLSGLLYWYALYPLHQIIFAGMLRRIVQAVQLKHQTA
jgi:uncharacterized protein YbjT (DUF2867 family)